MREDADRVSPRSDGRRASRQLARRDTHTPPPLARALGWLGVGLGAAQLLAPRAMSRTIGIRESDGIMRLLGVRELATGIGLVALRQPAPWLWGRIAGDAMDLALLGTVLGSRRSDRSRVIAATVAVAGVAALDLIASQQHARRRVTAAPGDRMTFVQHSVSVSCTPEEAYRFWRNFANLPRFMRHLESVQMTGSNRSHWVARGPLGTSVQWDAEITGEREGEYLAWRSLPGAEVDNSGRVHFERDPAGRGTVVRVTMQYGPPAGRLGVLLARLTGEEPGMQVREDLRRFKQVMETGEIPTTRGQPHGRRALWARALRREGAVR